MAHESFRAGAGAVILDAEGRVLAFDRSDVAGSAWQLPQGGLQRGEEPEAAVLREVQEETGITRAELSPLGRLPEPLAYELPETMRSPKTGRGQVGYWFFFRLKPGVSARRPPKGEFCASQPMRFAALIEAAVPFRKPVYERLARYLEDELLPDL